MQRVVHIPEDLAARIDEQLEFERKAHPMRTFSALVRRAVERQMEADLRPSILELAGIDRAAPDEEGLGAPVENHRDPCEDHVGTLDRTIFLPEDLDEQVGEYLEDHPGLSFTALVCQALEREAPHRDASALLKLIGLVSVEPDEIDKRFADHPEDRFYELYDGRPR